jgi:nucleotide-binding universal stress UspA family protein
MLRIVSINSTAAPIIASIILKMVKSLRLLDELVLKAREQDVVGTLFVKEGETSKKILEAAQEIRADVILMGSHGRMDGSALGSLLLGGVSRQIAMNADCPVFIIKP